MRVEFRTPAVLGTPSLATPRNPCDLSLAPSRLILPASSRGKPPAARRGRRARTGQLQPGRAADPLRNCLLCHGPDAKARKADLRLDVKESALRKKEPIIVPGKSDESELIRRIKSDDPDELMPPPKSGHS